MTNIFLMDYKVRCSYILNNILSITPVNSNSTESSTLSPQLPVYCLVGRVTASRVRLLEKA